MRGAQRGHDRRRRAFRREYPDPQIIFDVVAELLERRHVGQQLRRVAPNMASGRSLPALTCGSVADTDCVVTWALLPRMAVMAGPPPLVGR